MLRRPPSSTLTDTLFPYTSLFLSHADGTRNVVCDGVGDRFAVVECPQHRIIEKAFPDALCDGTQHHLALHRRRASPNREGPSGCFDGTIDVNGVSGLNISEISAGGRVLQCDRLAAIAADPLAANKMTVGLARGKPASSLPGLVQRQLHDRLLILFGVFTLSSTGSRGAKKTDRDRKSTRLNSSH